MNYQEWKNSFQAIIGQLYEPSDCQSVEECYQEQRIITMKALYPEYWERWKSDKP